MIATRLLAWGAGGELWRRSQGRFGASGPPAELVVRARDLGLWTPLMRSMHGAGDGEAAWMVAARILEQCDPADRNALGLAPWVVAADAARGSRGVERA